MRRARPSEAGFTLAGLIVILTIMMIFVSSTVPRQWSQVMQRERDLQTIAAMKEYARAIEAFRLKNGSYPTSLDQIRKARTPRLIRGSGPILDPLTGEDDWIVVPAAAVQQQAAQQNQMGPGGGRAPRAPVAPAPGVTPNQPNAPGGGFVGPIAGVRPNKTGKSIIALFDAENYEEWQYTAVDLQAEMNARRAALLKK